MNHIATIVTKGWKDKKPVISCIHPIFDKSLRRMRYKSTIMKPWTTIDKEGKVEKGALCPECYRSEHITV